MLHQHAEHHQHHQPYPIDTPDEAAPTSTYYTVDLTQEGYPVYYFTAGAADAGIFSGPFDDPGEASQEFKACWGSKGACEYLDEAAFQSACEKRGIEYRISYIILSSVPGGHATYLPDGKTGKTGHWLTQEGAMVEVLALKPHTPKRTYDILEETTIGRTRATRFVCTFPGKEPALDEREYLAEVLRTCTLPPEDQRERLCLGALGLAGEAGEVADRVKKYCYQGHSLERMKLFEELGDVLWYIMLLCHTLDFSLDEVLRGNREKLRQRYPHGFEAARSLQREEARKEAGI